MDVKAAGAGLMAGITHADGFTQDSRPGHFVLVVVQGHGVGYQLHAVVQGTVVLDVELFQAVPVGDVKKLPGPVVPLSALVDLQLHAEEAVPLAIEDRRGLIVVALNGMVRAVGVIAHFAVTLVIVVRIVQLVVAHELAALTAVGIITVPTVLTQGDITASAVIIGPDTFAAVVAEHCQFIPAGRAEVLAAEHIQFRAGILLPAVGAEEGVIRRSSPLISWSKMLKMTARMDGVGLNEDFIEMTSKNEDSRPDQSGRLHFYDIWLSLGTFSSRCAFGLWAELIPPVLSNLRPRSAASVPA